MALQACTTPESSIPTIPVSIVENQVIMPVIALSKIRTRKEHVHVVEKKDTVSSDAPAIALIVTLIILRSNARQTPSPVIFVKPAIMYQHNALWSLESLSY
jgi:hypothetical protein